MLIYCKYTQYLVGAPFALITASIQRGMEVISLWHCGGVMKAQVSLTVAFSSSEFFWSLVSSFFPLDNSGLESLLASQAHQRQAEGSMKCSIGLKKKNTMDQHQQMTLHPKSSQTVQT